MSRYCAGVMAYESDDVPFRNYMAALVSHRKRKMGCRVRKYAGIQRRNSVKPSALRRKYTGSLAHFELPMHI